MSELPWFRFYSEFASDALVQMLAFEDQRHFVMTLCMKCKGMLDKQYPSPELRSRVISAFLGLDPVACGEANRRLRELGLVDELWNPINWEKRQFQSDTSTERVRRFREKKQGNGDVTFQKRSGNGLDSDAESEADSDTDSEGESDARASRPSATKVEECGIADPSTKPDQSQAIQAAGTMTVAGAMARILRDLEVAVTSFNPILLGWLQDGFTVEQVVEATEIARKRKPLPEQIAPGYIDSILRKPQSAPVQKPADRTKWPAGFALDAELRAYVTEHLSDADPDALFEKFRLLADTHSRVYANWGSAFMAFVQEKRSDSGHWSAGQYVRRKVNGAAAKAFDPMRDLVLKSEREATALHTAITAGKSFNSQQQWDAHYRGQQQH